MEKFITVAPQSVAEAFEEVGALAVPGEDLVGTHNKIYADLLNSKGLTLFNETEFENKLQFMYSESMPYGGIMEFINIEIPSWTDSPAVSGAPAGFDPLKHYEAKIFGAYSTMSGVANAPTTIYDKAVRRLFKDPAQVDSFYTAHIKAQRRAMDKRRQLMAQEAIHRKLTDSTYAGASIVLDGITSIEAEGFIDAFSDKLYELVIQWDTDTSNYNADGTAGQAKEVIVMIKPNVYSKYRLSERRIYHEDPLVRDRVTFVPIGSFGGETSSVEAKYAAGDGSQTADMSAATFTDPHSDIVAVVMERGAVFATTDWADVETERVARSRATIIDPQSEHHFGSRTWLAFTAIKLDEAVTPPVEG